MIELIGVIFLVFSVRFNYLFMFYLYTLLCQCFVLIVQGDIVYRHVHVSSDISHNNKLRHICDIFVKCTLI